MEILDRLNIHTNEDLYRKAFTHTSYSNEHDVESYERLEFLGDAVLELTISDYLYNEKHLEEGTMTKMRASYVCEEACATYSRELGFEKEILLGSGENEANTTILADVFESFIGAMYIDQGFSYTSKFVMNIIIKYIEKKIDFLHDYKSALQELLQSSANAATYEVIDEQGPSHDRVFTVIVKIDDLVLGQGIANSKKEAEQRAAKDALSKQAIINNN